MSAGTPPASPGATRRLREEDVFLRLTGSTTENSPQGIVKEVVSKRLGGGGAWLQCTHVCEGHAGAALSLLATNRHLYSGGVDRTVRAWDVCGRGEAWRGCAGGAVAALAAAGGALLAAAGGGVRIFDTRTHHPLHTLWSSGGTTMSPRGEAAVTGVALAGTNRLYMAVADKLRLWDLRMMECVCKLWSGHAAAIMCLAVAEDGDGGDFVATGSKDHYVRTLCMNNGSNGSWEGSSRRLLQPPHYDGVQALALAADALYSGSRDSSLKRWSRRDHALTHSVMNAHKGWVTSVCVLEGPERLVASAGRDATLRLWGEGGAGGGGGGGGELRPLAAPMPLPDAPHALAANNHSLYTAGNGGEVRVWRLSLEQAQ